MQLFLFSTTQQNRKDKKMATETKDPQKKSNAITRFLGEFKEFISKGNVLDMAVGVVVGSAFTAIVNALVDNVLMPLVGAVIAGINSASIFRGAIILISTLVHFSPLSSHF